MKHNLNVAILGIPIPKRMKMRPISDTGYPVPWFVARIGTTWDFRIIGPKKVVEAVKLRRCWLCGQGLGKHMTFAVGPMCTVNRVSAEPPSHLECAQYAVMACPFLTKPKMRRNEIDLPEDRQDPAGIKIMRNPGVVALWTTRRFDPFRVGDGVLFRIGEPEHVEWYAEGRKATRAEVEASIASGLPLLQKAAVDEGSEAVAELNEHYIEARTLLPA